MDDFSSLENRIERLQSNSVKWYEYKKDGSCLIVRKKCRCYC